MAELPGFAATEIVAVAETGLVISKQAYLGDTEPTMKELADWATKQGYVKVASQPDDPVHVPGTDLPTIEGASSAMPLYTLYNGRPCLILDVVPRNARKLPSGEIILFDATPRLLSDEEVQAHHDLVAAHKECLKLAADRKYPVHGVNKEAAAKAGQSDQKQKAEEDPDVPSGGP